MSIDRGKFNGFYKILLFILLVVVLYLGFAMVQKKPALAPVMQNEPANIVSYSCDAGKTIVAYYYEGETKLAPSPDMPPVPGGRVKLQLSDGRDMTLPQTISADGSRYANPDESFVFWEKGNGALVLENNQQKSYIGCIKVAPQTGNLPQVYSSSQMGFSLRYPDGFTVDAKYKYQALGPGQDIYGVKFTIPSTLAAGTNLGSDSYLSVEEIYKAKNCSAKLFLPPNAAVKAVTDNGTDYSVATMADAGAGNRYDETVYALPGTNPCMAIRYFIHYSVFENYPAGTVKEFDQAALLSQFDQIRRTLTVQ